MFRRFFRSGFAATAYLAELIGSMPVEGPDFICIGMPKAGTSWLYDQLSTHPDFWMPRVKELQYLNHRHPPLRHVERHARQVGRTGRTSRSLRRAGDAAQSAFVADLKALAGKEMDIGRYATLFRHKGERLSGDISPPYVSLSEDVVGEVGRHLPEVKVLFLVREPIDRLRSSLSMNYRKGKFDRTLLEDAKHFDEFFRDKRLDDRLFPTRVLNRWLRSAPNLRLRTFLFDDIAADADAVRRGILEFLAADPEKHSGELPADYNRKANAPKLFFSDPVKELLLGYFADEIRACAETFGGSARKWVERYGL